MDPEEEIGILRNNDHDSNSRRRKSGKSKFDYLRKTSDTNKRFIRYGIRVFQTVNVVFYLTVNLIDFLSFFKVLIKTFKDPFYRWLHSVLMIFFFYPLMLSSHIMCEKIKSPVFNRVNFFSFLKKIF